MDALTLKQSRIRSTVRPKFIYAYTEGTRTLYMTNLLTGEKCYHLIRRYQFKYNSCWSELPGGSLLITGGGNYASVGEVFKIETLREWAVSTQPPMCTARQSHAVVYHSQYLYVLGGVNQNYCLSECERYVCAESRWEELPALLIACSAMSAVVLDNRLYVLGGSITTRYLDTVQKLSLDSLTWKLMRLKLPQAASGFPCFKTDNQVYLLIKETLYSFTPQQVKPIKTVPQGIECSTSYYSRGTLYYSSYSEIERLEIGELTNLS
jgi:hypothetical protein